MSDDHHTQSATGDVGNLAGEARQCLAGGGEMGALMRRLDWSKTPVGPVGAWPQSLRTAVSILLDSRFPMYIAWGREYTQFYNDGYRPILGSTKHPAAMGLGTSETFSESWHIIGPMFEEVMQGKAVGSEDWMLPLDRHGYLEECYFTFSYSPIRAESGVGGVHVTVTETTTRVLHERRLRTLRDAAAHTALAHDEPEAWQKAADALATNAADIPFALFYKIDGERELAVLTASTCASEAVVAISELRGQGSRDPSTKLVAGGDYWPVFEAIRSGRPQLVGDIRTRLGDYVGAQWPEPIEKALVLPIARAGGAAIAYGALVIGISPRRQLDDAYRDFCSLVADQVATAIGNSRAYEEERARAKALAELDRSKTAFFSNVSHEFRTPLTLMLGPMEDALISGALSGDALETVYNNTLRLHKLVNALLDFSRLQAGRLKAEYVAGDIAQITRELAGMFESAMARAGLKFIVRCDDIASTVYFDRNMYETIVLNLLSNALKFTFEGEIEIALAETKDRVRLSVRDTGVGVDPSELSRLFERFHRIEGVRARTHEGSGIGLALVKDLCELHGGSISAVSTPGAGSTFTVEIPTGRAHLPDEQIKAAVASDATARSATAIAVVKEALQWLPGAGSTPSPELMVVDAGGTQEARILVVDDNADMRNYLLHLLAPPWIVEAVVDGVEALRAVRANPPDLIVTDIMMPNLDGFGLLHELRADPKTSLIPVIMLSARAGEEARLDGLAEGADDYLIKPFSARELIARVRSNLEIARLREQGRVAAARLHDLFMQSPVAISVIRGPDHRYELTNPRYLEMVNRQELVGKTIAEAWPETVGTPLMEVFDQVYASGEPFFADEYKAMLNRTGTLEECFFKFNLIALRERDGSISGMMCTAVEITDLVRARQQAEALAAELRASEQALQTSELQFRTLADTMPLLAWYAEPDGTIPWYNQRWYEYTGTTPESPSGGPWEWIQAPDDRARATAGWKAAVASGEPWEDQFRLRRHDGIFRWFLSRAIPLRDAGGEIIRWFGTHVDIEEQKRAAEAAEAANRAKDDFLAILGHELRNPLSPILTALRLMRERGTDEFAWERTVIERQAHHLVRLVDDLLDVSRITLGKVELKKAIVELSQIVAKAVETASPLLDQRQHELVIDVAGQGLALDADPERLAQVIANLLTNAAKYTEEGGRITISASRDRDDIVIQVCDNGIGIAPEMLARVFTMFEQEPQALDRSQGGLGLGLTIVQNLVSLHGGSVEIHSAGRGHGTQVFVRLPAAPARATAISGDDTAQSVVSPNAAKTGHRILIVDDNEDAAKALAAWTELMGHTSRVAFDGPSALETVGEFTPDVALLDIGLPVMDGYELASRLRKQRGGEELLLIAITGYGQESDCRRSEDAGFDAHLVKPIDLATLTAALERLSERRT